MLTACTASYKNYNDGQVIKYDDIRANKGITDTARFLSSGVLMCQNQGLYIVMVSMYGLSSNSYYWIKKNNTNMLFIESIRSNDGLERTVSGSFAIDLVKGDSIYVIPNTNVRVNAHSCLSVVKIK